LYIKSKRDVVEKTNMQPYLKTSPVCGVLLVLIVILAQLTNAQDRFIGSKAPEFSLPEVSSNLKTNYVFSQNLNLDSSKFFAVCFFASWCGLCRQEMMFVKDLADSLYKDRLCMVAVCIENNYEQEQQEFVKNTGLTCKVLLDSGKAVAKKYHMKKQLPYSVLITDKGIVYTTVSGYSSRAEFYIRYSLQKMMGKK
jgi:peroxiredoxin